jgi:hypothetical protein
MANPTAKSDRPTYTADYVRADYDAAVFMGNPLLDSMYTSLTALSAHVWAVQRRMRIVEILLEKNGSVTRDMIEKYVPTKEEAAQLMKERDAFVAEINDPFKESGEIPYAASLHPPGLEPDKRMK